MLLRANEFALDLKSCGIAICDQTSKRNECPEAIRIAHIPVERGKAAKQLLCLITIVFPSAAYVSGS
jgi:hypothetical protein